MDVFQMRAAVREEEIESLVRRFYDRARSDDLLGPVFRTHVPDDRWEEHLAKIVDFWSTALRGTGRYRANPIAAHLTIRPPRNAVSDSEESSHDHLQPEHFERWLTLFDETARQVFSDEISTAIRLRAERMARHMDRVLERSAAEGVARLSEP